VPADKDFGKAAVLVVGAGPAGLSAAIRLKTLRPDADVLVLDKAGAPGNHALSGAVLELAPLAALLDEAEPAWRASDPARDLLARPVERDDVLFFPTRRRAVSMMPVIKAARLLHLGLGQMIHQGDYLVSISRLTRWLAAVAQKLGVEVLHGFAVEDILYDPAAGRATGVKMVDQGRDQAGRPQPNFVPGETVRADVIVLAEGCDGLVTEKLVQRAGLQRRRNQLFSVGVKELIEVSPERYQAFGDRRVVQAMGFPLWTPLVGPAMFGGGILYGFGANRLAVGVIVGADWKYCDFNPQEALAVFKTHAFVQRYLEGGTVVEAGAKMIPEGGYDALPRDPATGAIGKANVVIVGDSAGLVNMLKIKGLHHAVASGALAGEALARLDGRFGEAAATYTRLLEASPVRRELYPARNFRQTVARWGPALGLPLAVLGPLLPRWHVERDYLAMKPGARYKYRPAQPFDKDAFAARAAVQHREDQPCHCRVRDERFCIEECPPKYGRPCITFCPGGVYELVHGQMKPAHPSNCVHCKTCQNKCPYDNLRWTAPEGGGGPRYKNM